MNRLKSGAYGNSSILKSTFNGTNVDDMQAAFELFAPGNSKQDAEQFEVIIRSVQFASVVLPDGFGAVFILKPRFDHYFFKACKKLFCGIVWVWIGLGLILTEKD